MRPIRIVIADRRPIVLQGFATLFAAESDFEIVASCNSGAACLAAVRRLMPDVALVEDRFSDLPASEMLAAVKTEHIPTRLVFYTASIAQGDLAAAIAAGACAGIPMRDEPEAVMHSLRLVAPAADRGADGKANHGAFRDMGLAALTDLERKIVRLVASGMSDREIARQLKVATGTINARIDRISAQLRINSRRELATFALSRLYGGVGALAALIWAALDDVRPASAHADDHALTDTVTVTAADGTVLTIKITPQKTTAAPGKMAKAVDRADRIETLVADSPTRAGKLLDSRADLAARTITSPTSAAATLALNGFGTLVWTAIGAWICELLASPAQALTSFHSPGDSFAADAANATSEFAALTMAGAVDANLDGVHDLAWLNSEPRNESFTFAAARGDAFGRGDELQVTDAVANADGARGDGDVHVGAGAVDALTDHGGLAQADRADTPGNAEPGKTQAAEADGSDHGQSQRDFHVSDEGAANGKPHADHAPPGQDPTQKQSQRDIHASEEGNAKAKPHAEPAPPGHDPTHKQSQHDIHASEEGNAKAKPHAEHAPPGHESDHTPPHHEVDASKHAAPDDSHKSQPDADKAHPNASEHPHGGPSEHAGGNDHSSGHAGPTQPAAATALGDSFDFRNDMAAAKPSDHLQGNQGPHADASGLHNGGHDGPALIQDADLTGPSHAEHGVVDHARGIEHHQIHDWLV